MEYTKEELDKVVRLAWEVMMNLYNDDRSGRLLYLFVKKLSGMSRLKGFGIDEKYKFVVIPYDEYNKLKGNI